MRAVWAVAAMTAVFAAPAPEAWGQSLGEAMRQGLESNSGIAARRARLDAAREAIPQARAEILPSLSGRAGATVNNRDGGGFPTSETENWNGGLAATQLIYAGGRVGALTRQARASVVRAEADYIGAEQTFLLDVTRAYADVRQTEAAVAASRQTVDAIDGQRAFADARLRAGLATRTDLAQAEARLAQARTQLVQAEGQAAAAVEAYRRLVGAAPSGLTEPSAAPGLPESLEQALDVALAGNPVVRAAEAGALEAAAGTSLARSAGRVRAALEAGQDLSDQFDGDDPLSAGSVGVRVTVPFFTGGAVASRTRQARAVERSARLDADEARARVRELTTAAWTGLLTARASEASAAEQVRAAELAARGVRVELDVGLRTTVEALDQELDLLNARLARASAERDRVVAERQLLAAMGALAPE